MLSNILDRIAFWSLFLVISLLPVFFLPFTKIPAETSKSLLMVVGLTVAMVAWAGARFSDGKIILPRSNILLGGFFIVLATLLSALFSTNQETSFFGVMFDVGTFWFMLTAFLMMLSTALIAHSAQKAKLILYGFLTSSVFLVFFQTLRYFWPDYLSFNILVGKTANLVGTWNSFGFLAGLGAVASVFLLEFIRMSDRLQWFVRVLFALSVFTLMVVNSVMSWLAVGIFVLFLFIYRIAISAEGGQENVRKSYFPIYAFGLVVLSLLFFLSGNFIGDVIPKSLGIANIEVSPSVQTTMTVGKNALTENMIFGMGANRFGEAWALWKPQIMNDTQFWDTYFNTGFGFIPTAIINTGFIGLLAWFLFFVFLFSAGFKFLLETLQHKNNFTTMLFMVAGLFLLLISFFYASGITIIMLTFAFIGLFIGQYSLGKKNGFWEIDFLKDPRQSFFSILLLVFLMLATSGLAFKFVERFASVPYFNGALLATDAKTSEALINKAISLHESDLYFRTYTQVQLANLTILSQKQDLTQTEKTDLQMSFDKAVQGASRAINYDDKNYVNHQMLGIVYTTAGRLGVDGAEEKAIESYLVAAKLNPLNPGLRLAIANEYLALQKNQEAKSYAEEAVKLAPRYADALIVLSRIERNLGNNQKALEYGERVLSLNPENKVFIEYVNSLKVRPALVSEDKDEE